MRHVGYCRLLLVDLAGVLLFEILFGIKLEMLNSLFELFSKKGIKI